MEMRLQRMPRSLVAPTRGAGGFQFRVKWPPGLTPHGFWVLRFRILLGICERPLGSLNCSLDPDLDLAFSSAAGWLAGWLAGWMAAWLAGCLAGWLSGWLL